MNPPSQRTIDLGRITGLVADDLENVERVLREGASSVAALITEAGEHTFASGGKRVRPLLVLLSARLCGYRGPRAVQIAASAELLHAASLIHDDVVDGAETRRGRPSVNAQFGQRLAVLAGDFFFAQSSSMLVEDGNLDILGIYADAIRKMAEGEVLQLSSSFDPEIPESVYLDVIGRKTATLLATATESGAILGEVTRTERRALRDYGWQLGLAFQIVDDALDYSSSDAELGKAQFTDLAEGKITLPLLSTLKRCTVSEREATQASLKSFALRAAREEDPPGAGELEPIAALVRRYQGGEAALERARAATDLAKSRIRAFVDCDAKQALVDLADFVLQRRA